jgi:hypothetical protein
MSSKAPSYLWKNRYGVFYFRLIIPSEKCYKHHLKREIKKSLRTTNRQEAIAKARVLKVQLDDILSHAVNNRPSNLADPGIIPRDWITLISCAPRQMPSTGFSVFSRRSRSLSDRG